MVESTDARGSRPGIIGPDSGPEPPFPLRMGGKVVSGFGRGSKELGIPTANIPVDTTPWISSAESGVYFGWASVKLPPDHPSLSPSAESASSAEPSTSFMAPSSVSAVPAPRPPPAAAAAGLPEQGWRVYPMVMSIGFNPFYKNTVRSAEVHVMRKFARDFYGCEMRVLILGFVRKELDYVSLEALVEDIRTDIEVAGRSLGREAWMGTGGDGWLWGEGEI